jgi:prophage regulatory protein
MTTSTSQAALLAATLPATIPQDGFVRLPKVLAVIPVSRSTWLEGVRTGRFPKPVKLGRRATAWRAEDIRALIDRLAEAA